MGCPALELAGRWVELGLSIETEISGRALAKWYCVRLRGLWSSSDLNSALPPQRLRSDTWPEHPHPVNHTVSMWLWVSALTSLCFNVCFLIYRLVFVRDALPLYLERYTVVNLPGTSSDFRKCTDPQSQGWSPLQLVGSLQRQQPQWGHPHIGLPGNSVIKPQMESRIIAISFTTSPQLAGGEGIVWSWGWRTSHRFPCKTAVWLPLKIFALP